MRQITLASQTSFEKYGRKSKREQFLETMEEIVPWAELSALIEPHYPKAGNGRQPVGFAIMLRVYFLQQWFNLSDPGVEDALYESPALRRFAGVDLGRSAAPDETTILRFRHLLEEPAGGARSVRPDAGHGEPVSGAPGHPHRHGDHCGCDHHSRTLVDQELQWRA